MAVFGAKQSDRPRLAMAEVSKKAAVPDGFNPTLPGSWRPFLPFLDSPDCH